MFELTKCTVLGWQIKGTIIAPGSVDAWKWPGNDKDKWIQFSNINGLSVNGDGLIDGQGAPWWDCYDKNKCERPTVSFKAYSPNIIDHFPFSWSNLSEFQSVNYCSLKLNILI